MVTLADGRALVVGGVTWFQPALQEAELFDPKGDVWSTVKLKQKRAKCTATRLKDGRVLVTGGETHDNWTKDGDRALHESELFDPASNQFSVTGSMSSTRFLHAAVLLADGRVLVSGGRGAPAKVHDPDGDGMVRIGDFDVNAKGIRTAEIYDPKSGKWTAAAKMKRGRYLHTLSLLADGRVLAAGGFSAKHYGPGQDSAEIYDPAKNTWTEQPLIAARGGHRAVTLADGSLLLIGGNLGGSLPIVWGGGNEKANNPPRLVVFNPEGDRWRSTSASGAENLRVVPLPDGRLLAVGGGKKPDYHSAAVVGP